jgi:hypothetical protein
VLSPIGRAVVKSVKGSNDKYTEYTVDGVSNRTWDLAKWFADPKRQDSFRDYEGFADTSALKKKLLKAALNNGFAPDEWTEPGVFQLGMDLVSNCACEISDQAGPEFVTQKTLAGMFELIRVVLSTAKFTRSGVDWEDEMTAYEEKCRQEAEKKRNS